jgi:hypothetical protein
VFEGEDLVAASPLRDHRGLRASFFPLPYSEEKSNGQGRPFYIAPPSCLATATDPAAPAPTLTTGFVTPPQSEYGPKGQGSSKPRENRLYVAVPICTCSLSGLFSLLSILLSRLPRLEAQPSSASRTTSPRKAKGKEKRIRMLFDRTVRRNRMDR